MRFLSVTLNFCQLPLSATVGLTGSSIILWYLDEKEHLLTFRHVGIFLILFQWMEKENILPRISHTWKGRGTLNENSFCTIGSFGRAINCQCTIEQMLEPGDQDFVWAGMVPQLVQRFLTVFVHLLWIINTLPYEFVYTIEGSKRLLKPKWFNGLFELETLILNSFFVTFLAVQYSF